MWNIYTYITKNDTAGDSEFCYRGTVEVPFLLEMFPYSLVLSVHGRLISFLEPKVMSKVGVRRSCELCLSLPLAMQYANPMPTGRELAGFQASLGDRLAGRTPVVGYVSLSLCSRTNLECASQALQHSMFGRNVCWLSIYNGVATPIHRN